MLANNNNEDLSNFTLTDYLNRDINKPKKASANGEEWSNAVTQQEIEAGTKLTQQLLEMKAARDAQTAASGCKKPLINLGKKKKAYEECLANAQALKNTPTYMPLPSHSGNKKNFFNTPVGIATVLFGAAALIGGAILIIKFTKK